MTIQQLTYAVKAAETKSINKAAAQLYISQPALSGAIRSLEDELNIKIFSRTNKGIELTPEGEEFIVYARKVCDELQEIDRRFCN